MSSPWWPCPRAIEEVIDHGTTKLTENERSSYTQCYGHGRVNPRPKLPNKVRSLDRLEGSVHRRDTNNTTRTKNHPNTQHRTKTREPTHNDMEWSSTYDEDIATLDTPTLWSFPSCNSSPTQLPRHPRIQQTRRHCFGHNSLIRHQNRAFLDALERGRRRHRFGSGPSSRRSVDHSV
jgi:hypothetical protein